MTPLRETTHRPLSPAFPLGLCAAAIAMTSAGLAAAAWGIKWGAAPPPGDALGLAWVYVNQMLLLTSAVLWPAIALRPKHPPCRITLLRQASALLIGALPSLIVAAFLSAITPPALLAAAALQLAVVLLAAGMIRVDPRSKGAATLLLAAWFLAAPCVAFLCTDLLPHAWSRWTAALPSLSILHLTSQSPSAAALPTAAHAALGLLLLLLPLRSPQNAPIPATATKTTT